MRFGPPPRMTIFLRLEGAASFSLAEQQAAFVGRICKA
jgi:hypothetical protein